MVQIMFIEYANGKYNITFKLKTLKNNIILSDEMLFEMFLITRMLNVG